MIRISSPTALRTRIGVTEAQLDRGKTLGDEFTRL
jgi:hypothetical protein